MSQTVDLESNAILNDVRAFSSVRTRRILAFMVDFTIVLLLLIPAAIVVGILGVITFGLGWLLYAALLPLVAILYVGFTMGSGSQATIGMRLFGIRLMRLDGAPVDSVFAVLHAVLFWASIATLTPLVLLFSLFTRRKELLHDYLLGTVVIRNIHDLKA
ncbi:RDD family protein [Aureimonas fodinaquatilis]|uniref:RDD family protein n=1 Tax=Aureimonas fodinaquatilis TaxID=2565783 RepID=A0A5B0DWK2_9HYPH|nr:RDD family protein [Aureimonas fodinaquatilis]KAA0970245.1 RDD family protein [Aureimonas fodinaquatilis]